MVSQPQTQECQIRDEVSPNSRRAGDSTDDQPAIPGPGPEEEEEPTVITEQTVEDLDQPSDFIRIFYIIIMTILFPLTKQTNKTGNQLEPAFHI